MGCCASTPRSTHGSSPYDNNPPAARLAPATTSASRSANAASPPTSALPSRTATTTTPPRPTASAPNKPLKPAPAPHKVRSPGGARWTRKRLLRERDEFWETRVTGREEVWQVLRLVVELLARGELGEAQAVFDAGGCLSPTGEVWRGVFDERGEKYEIPEWAVGEPGDLVEEVDGGEEEEGSEVDDKELLEDEDGGNRAEKGKAREVDVGEIVRVRARLSDRGTDVVVKIGMEECVRVLVRRIRELADIPGRDKIKIGYAGKILQESSSLPAQGWHEGHVVNAFVFQ